MGLPRQKRRRIPERESKMRRDGLDSRTTPKPKQAILYARVSSKEQEREGFSIQAQQKLLRPYAAENGIKVAREFTDIETAKTPGGRPSARWAFHEAASTRKTRTARFSGIELHVEERWFDGHVPETL